jgi:DNA segregation ATPase FtsK/SpoIIIE-like protein
MGDIPNFITRSIDKRLAFRMNEAEQLQQVIGGRYEGDSSTLAVGRGLWRGSPPLQLQVALAGQALDIQTNARTLQQLGERMMSVAKNDAAFDANRPYQIGHLADMVDLEELITKDDIVTPASVSSVSLVLGQREDNLKPYITVLGEEADHALILGRRKSGRTTLLQTFALSAAYMYPVERLRIVLVAPDAVIRDKYRISLADLEGLPHNPYNHIIQTPEQLQAFLQDLRKEFQRRFQQPNVDYPQILVIIDDAKQIFEATDIAKSGSRRASSSPCRSS